MLKKVVALGVSIIVVTGLAACSASGSESANTGDESASVAAAGPSAGVTIVTLNDDYADALPLSSQLAIGTLLLEGTENTVTVEQAGKLLPNWQMLEALQSSGTAAEAELDAVLNQIQAAMTDGQLTAIKEMRLTPDNMMQAMQEQGLDMGRAGGTGSMGGNGAFQPPEGVALADGVGPGGQFSALGGDQELSPEEQEAAMAERMSTMMAETVVSLLEARAEGESWEIAAANQEMALQSELIAVIAEATGLEQGEITAQARQGQTLVAIAKTNGVDVDEIVAQVMAADTEQVNQAVADGLLEQADADQWLVGLEAQVKEMLEGTLPFGWRGALGS